MSETTFRPFQANASNISDNYDLSVWMTKLAHPTGEKIRFYLWRLHIRIPLKYGQMADLKTNVWVFTLSTEVT